MKNRRKHWLRIINLIAVFTLIAVTIVQLSSGATGIFAAEKELSLSSEADLTNLKAGDEFVVTINDSREISDFVTTENSELPLADKSVDILEAVNATDTASVSRQWTMTLPKGVTFDEASETAMLQEADANAVLPTFSFDEETRVLDITVDSSVTELDLKLFADTAGEYQLSVADKNIMLTDSEKLAVVVGEVEVAEVLATEATETDNADVTEAVQGGRNENGRSFTTVQAPNGDYDRELTLSQWGGVNNTWGDIPTNADGSVNNSQIIHVYNSDQLTRALRGNFTAAYGNDPVDQVPYNQKNSAPYIMFMNNIDNGSRVLDLGVPDVISITDQRSVVIDGNGFLLSTGARYYQWNSVSVTNTRYAISLYIKNLDMYSQNPYGTFSIWRNRYSSMIYENTTYTGSQLSASYLSTQVYRGTNTFANVRSFVHPISGTTLNTYNGTAASGLEGRRVYVQTGSNTTFTAETGDGVILGAFWSDDVTTQNSPILHIESNATLNIEARGNGGESYGFNSGNGVVYSAVSIQDGGSLTLAEGATMNVDTSGTARAGIRLTGGQRTSNRGNTTVDIAKNAKVNVVTNGNMGSNVGSGQYQYYAGLSMYNNSRINLAEEGAERNINMQNDRFMNRVTGIFSPGIYMGTNAGVNIAGGATMNLNMNGSFGSALRMVGANSTFNVANNGTANFIASNQAGIAYQGDGGTPSQIGSDAYQAWSELVYVNTGTFTVGRNGTFVMRVEDGTGWRSMLYANTGRFTFSDAKQIDIDAQANDNAQLINMNGTFIADIQIVYAWNKGSTGKDPTTDRDFYWAPIYNANVSYSRGSAVTSTVTSVNSIEEGIAESFTQNYHTENFSRVLYEQVPDVNVSIDDISDNETQVNGQQVSGVVNPDSFVAIYLTPISTGVTSPLTTLESSGQVDQNNQLVEYNETSDANGDYTLTIPEGTTLYVGDIITVRGFRWGKEDTQTFVVLDQTGPNATVRTYYTFVGNTNLPQASDFVDEDSSGAKLITDKGVPDATAATYPIAYSDTTDIANLVTTPTGDNGITIQIVVSDLATRPGVDGEGNPTVDPAPNSTTIDVTLVVAGSQSGMAVTPDRLDIDYSATRNLSDADLSSHILNLEGINLLAWQISADTGQREEWTDPADFTITTAGLGTLADRTGWAVDTPYTVTINPTVSGLTDLSATTDIYIVNMEVSFSIEFVNDGGTTLRTLTVGQDDTYDIQANVLVGDRINLTAVNPYQAVVDQKTALLAAGYASVSLPTGVDETSVEITSSNQVITYTATGQLTIQSRPTTINFGTLVFNGQPQRVEDPTTNNDLIIADTRSDTTKGWVLKLALTERMYSQSTNSYMNDAIRYKTAVDTDDIILTDQAVEVYSEATGGTGLFNVTDTWGVDEGSVGLKLVADPKDTTNSDIGNYTGEITWTIESAP